MLAVVPFIAYVTWTVTNAASTDADCTISIQYPNGDLKEPQPLILKNYNFLYPEEDDALLRLRSGDTIHLACPGKNNYLYNEFWGDEAEATCVKDQIFNVNGNFYDFSSLVCAKDPADSAQVSKVPSNDCRYTSVDIGFNVGNTFIRIMEICRNDKTYATHYVRFHMTSHVANSQKSYPRPRFKQGTFYKGITGVDNLYQFDTQSKTLTKILGSSKLVEERLQKSSQFLARGHFAAKTDFVYGSQQKATFWFLNAAPQWQTFNDGNWKWLEISLRDMASNRRSELVVYTGIHEILTMEDINGVQQPIYLYPEGQALPVPKYFWKVVYNPSRKQGVALVGLNDPFIQSITNELKLCKDITKQITWLKWSPNNITAGFSYACTINELRKRVPEVPNLQVVSLLK